MVIDNDKNTPKSRKFNNFHLFDHNPPIGGEHLKIIEVGSPPFGG
jgi:hypothetical protein